MSNLPEMDPRELARLSADELPMTPEETRRQIAIERRFIVTKAIPAAIASVFGLYVSRYIGYLFDTPSETPELHLPSDAVGYPESYSNGKPFITKEKGPQEYIHEICMNEPVLRNVMARVFSEFIFWEGRRPNVTDVFARHLKIVQEEAQNLNLPEIEKVHFAIFSMAGLFGQSFTYGDLCDLGAIEKNESVNAWDTFEIAHYRKGIPIVLPHDKGADKIMHWANGAFVYFLCWYLNEHNLPDANRIPRIATWWLNMKKNPQKKAEAMATLGQYAWEMLETMTWFYGSLKQGYFELPVHTGYLDPDRKNDFRANEYGIQFAARLANTRVTPADIDGVLAWSQDFEP